MADSWVEAEALFGLRRLGWGDAGNSTLWECTYGGQPYVYKEYTDELRADTDIDSLGRLIAWRDDLPGTARSYLDRVAAWPRFRVRLRGVLTGVLIPRAPAEFFQPRPDGGEPRPHVIAELIRRRIAGLEMPAAPLAVKLGNLGRAAEVLFWFHSRDVVVNDLRELNILCTRSGSAVYYVDCDDMVGPWGTVASVVAPEYMAALLPAAAAPSPQTDLARLAWMATWILLDDFSLRAIPPRLATVIGAQDLDLLLRASRLDAAPAREWHELAQRWQDEAQHAGVPGAEGPVVRVDSASGGGQAGAPRLLAGVRSDDPSPIDLLRRGTDVDMLAELIAAADTQAPLAIALLGEWGAGKSSLMLQLRQRIDDIASASRQAPLPGSFVRSVRQVTFNAWHYADANLWPGLIGQIYHSLGDLSVDRDADAGDDVEQRRRTLRDDRTKHQQEADRLRDAQESIEAAARGTGRYGTVLSPARTFRAVKIWLGEEVRDFRATMRIFVQWLVLTYACFVIGFYVVSDVAPGLRWVYGLVCAALPSVVVVVAKVAAWAMALIDRGDKFDAKVRASLLDRENAARAEVARLSAQLAEVDAADALAQLLGAGKGAAAYEPYRGLLSQVHRDLDELDAALRKARQQWQDAGSAGDPPLERIVLYIDDLDRCDPRQVAEVLSAVHLLLALPLFVVVVAADPRWLVRSLGQRHADLFVDVGEGTADTDWRPVTPVDYLDKIFQVPFALPPMGSASASYLRMLLPGPAELLPDPAHAAAEDMPSDPVSDPVIPPGPAGRGPSQAVPSAPQDDRADHGTEAIPAMARHLQLTAQELDFIPRLGEFLPTPRSAKKMINIYRLIRIGVAEHERDAFVGTYSGGPYQAVAVLLACVVSAPASAATVLAAVANERDDAVDLLDVLHRMHGEPAIDLFAQYIAQIRWEVRAPLPITECRPWAEVVARFSFHTYKLAGGATRGWQRPAAAARSGRDAGRGRRDRFIDDTFGAAPGQGPTNAPTRENPR